MKILHISIAAMLWFIRANLWSQVEIPDNQTIKMQKMKLLKICFLCISLLLCYNLHSQIAVYSNNNVGIKTTAAPTEALEVNGSIRGNVGGGALKLSSSNGYAVIGSQDPSYLLFQTDRPLFIFNKTPLSSGGDFGSYYTTDLALKTGVSYYNTTGTTRLTIKYSNGYVGIGTTSPEYLLDVNGVIRVKTTTYSSDERLKENVADISNSLSSLKNLKGVSYNFKNNNDNQSFTANSSTKAVSDTSSVNTSTIEDTKTDDSRKHIGFIAQDLQKVFPELVYEDKDGILSVDYVSLIPVLVESMKELNEKVEKLENDNAYLKKKLGL